MKPSPAQICICDLRDTANTVCLLSERTAQFVCVRNTNTKGDASIAHIYEYIFWFLLGGFHAHQHQRILFICQWHIGEAVTKCTFSFDFYFRLSTSRFNAGNRQTTKQPKRKIKIAACKQSQFAWIGNEKNVWNIFQKILQAPPFLLFGCVCYVRCAYACAQCVRFFSMCLHCLVCKGETESERAREGELESVLDLILNVCYVCSARIKSFSIHAKGRVKRGSAFPHQKTYISMHTQDCVCVRLVTSSAGLY